ncbi:uncharacterized protein LOC135699169 [Ochlerotatus camptorhynchus]|uniref:uncharacterized protein LOC135699169 n=1 Tax=Ochlerotatus camptorhynchus TaxID=644619 RepID=UPI0031CE2AD6
MSNDSSVGALRRIAIGAVIREGATINQDRRFCTLLDGLNVRTSMVGIISIELEHLREQQGSENTNPYRHVPGIENPADMISRGLSPEDLIQNDFWWHGPRWLAEEENRWPTTAEIPTEDEHQIETRRTVAAGTSSTLANFNDWYISKFPNYTSLIRCTAVWQRLIRRLKTRSADHTVGFLTISELRQATIIRLIQRETFSEERTALSQGRLVSRKSPLRWFNPYLPEDQLLRVGGRLRHSNESEGTKHPLVLPAYHRLTRMITEHYHHILLHAGPQLLLSTIRLKFWPLGGRNVARQVVHRCLKCFRAKPPPLQQFMGELPSARVTVSRPFAKAGVDYFGPVFVRPGPRRVAVKAYVAVFICMATKAVHLELVSDLSTDRFLQALRRFIGRRGRCTDMYSDNGTNFVGARNRLQELFTMLRDSKHQEAVTKYCTNEGIQWHFNPPNAPHFGGLWEAAVRSAKHHLLRVVGEEPISPEDFQTLLV